MPKTSRRERAPRPEGKSTDRGPTERPLAGDGRYSNQDIAAFGERPGCVHLFGHRQ